LSFIDGHAHAFINAAVARKLMRIIGSGNGGFTRFIGSEIWINHKIIGSGADCFAQIIGSRD